MNRKQNWFFEIVEGFEWVVSEVKRSVSWIGCWKVFVCKKRKGMKSGMDLLVDNEGISKSLLLTNGSIKKNQKEICCKLS